MSASAPQAPLHKLGFVQLCGVFCLLGSLLIVGCGSKKPMIEKSTALSGAERLERRASLAYNKGDAIGAAKDFQIALQVYESLAMTDAAAGTQLSLAKIDSAEGRTKEAQTRVQGVLSQASTISSGTLLLAHGRAAALFLQQKNMPAAASSLVDAERLCAGTCEAASALLAMRANWSLASGDAAGAKAHAALALAQAQTQTQNPSDKANALRSLADACLALNQLQEAAGYAEQALQIDQTQGSSVRVIADLNLLAAIATKAGNSEQAAAYTALSSAATRARGQLVAK